MHHSDTIATDVLPFDLSNPASIFQQVMNKIVEDIDGVSVYGDDAIVHTPNDITHNVHSLEIFQRSNGRNVAANLRKYSFFCHQLCMSWLFGRRQRIQTGF